MAGGSGGSMKSYVNMNNPSRGCVYVFMCYMFRAMASYISVISIVVMFHVEWCIRKPALVFFRRAL